MVVQQEATGRIVITGALTCGIPSQIWKACLGLELTCLQIAKPAEGDERNRDQAYEYLVPRELGLALISERSPEAAAWLKNSIAEDDEHIVFPESSIRVLGGCFRLPMSAYEGAD